MLLTVVANNQTPGRQQLAVEDGIDVALVAVLVGVDEDEVKGALELLDRLVGVALDDGHAVADAVPANRGAGRRRHAGVQLQRGDLGLGASRPLVPRERAVSSVRAELEDLRSWLVLLLLIRRGQWGHTALRLEELGEELEGGPLQRGRHLVGILELVAGPGPELLHVGGNVLGVRSTVVRDRGGHLRLDRGHGQPRALFSWLSPSFSVILEARAAGSEVLGCTYSKGQDTGQHLEYRWWCLVVCWNWDDVRG